MAVCPCVILVGGGELNGDFVAASQVGVGNLGVGNLEGGLVLNVESHLSSTELRFAPVPTSERVLFGLQRDAEPDLERLADSIKVVWQKAIEMYESALRLMQVGCKDNESPDAFCLDVQFNLGVAQTAYTEQIEALTEKMVLSVVGHQNEIEPAGGDYNADLQTNSILIDDDGSQENVKNKVQ